MFPESIPKVTETCFFQLRFMACMIHPWAINQNRKNLVYNLQYGPWIWVIRGYLGFFFSFFLRGCITFKVTDSKDPELQLPDCLCDWKYIVGKKHVGLCHLLQVTYLVSFQFSHPKAQRVYYWKNSGLVSRRTLILHVHKFVLLRFSSSSVSRLSLKRKMR